MSKMFIGADFKSPLCRISYAKALHTADDNDKYSPTLIFPNADIGAIQKAVAECVSGQWGEKGPDRFKNGLIKNPIIAGDSKSARNKESGEIKPGMGSDVSFIRPWSKKPIKTFGPDVLPMDASEVNSGWYGYAVLTPFCWHNSEQGDGISFWISMWQHVRGTEEDIIGGEGGPKNPDAFFSKETIATDGDGEIGSGGAADMFG